VRHMRTGTLSLKKRSLVFLIMVIVIFGAFIFSATFVQAGNYDFDDGFGGPIDPNHYPGIALTVGNNTTTWQWFATFNECLHTSNTLDPKRYHVIGGSSMSLVAEQLNQAVSGTYSFDPAVFGTIRGVALSYSSGGAVDMRAYSAAGALLAQAAGPANLGTDRMNRLALNAATPISYVVVSGTPTENCADINIAPRIVLDNLETSPNPDLRPGYQLNSYAQQIDFPSNAAGNITPYPIPITVTNLPGPVGEVEAGITNFSHTHPTQLDFLLVGPSATGRKTILMSDVGSTLQFSNISLLFSSSATQTLPTTGQIAGGGYQPTNNNPIGDNDNFIAPAPTGPYSATMTVFNGINPNGVWNLFGRDDTATTGSGEIIRGWYLTFYTCEIVTKSNDDNTCGTLRYLVNYLNNPANAAQRATPISFSGVTNISLSSGITLATGIKIQGNCNPNTGPTVTINGNNSAGVGVRLFGNNTLTGIWIRGFNGVQLQAGSGRNFLNCTKVSRN
jgi:hypothetical protein